MPGDDGGGEDPPDRPDRRDRDGSLSERVETLEKRVEDLRRRIETSRLAVVDGSGRERMVAEARGSAIELRMPLPGSAPGRSTEVVVFAIEGGRGWSGGVGVQLWAGGSMVREMAFWDDESSNPSAAG